MEINRNKGYLFAFLSALAMSNVYIFSKATLKEIALPQFGFYWFGIALILLFSAILFRGDFKFIKKLDAKSIKVLLTIGFVDVISTSLFFLSIKAVDNPAIVSFLGNIKPMFVIFLGFIFLNERFKGIEILGLIIALLGGLILGYQPNLSFQMILDGGIAYIFLSMFFGAGSMIYMRKNKVKIPSIIYATSRSILLFIASLIFILIEGNSFVIPTTALVNVSLGALLGPFAAVLFSYEAIRNMEASRVSLVGTSKGVLVLIGAYLMFGKFPTQIQLIGGLTTILGVILITVGNRFRKSEIKK